MSSNTSEHRLTILELNRLLVPIPTEDLTLVETRSAIKNQLRDLVSSMPFSNVVIVGTPGCGRSSLLSKSISEIALLPNVEHFQLSIVDGNLSQGWLFRSIGRAISGSLDLGNNREDLSAQLIEFASYFKKMVFSIDSLELVDEKLMNAEFKNFNTFVHSRGISAHLLSTLGHSNPARIVAELVKAKVTAVSIPSMSPSEIRHILSEKVAFIPLLKGKNLEIYDQIVDQCEGNPGIAIQLLASYFSEHEAATSQPEKSKKVISSDQKKSKPAATKKQRPSFDDFLKTDTKVESSIKKAK